MPVNRKLVAVVVADVVGYSRLMERDEAGTHQRLRALHDELIAPKIAEHGGRTVKTSGDGMLLEFPSATSALRCAVELQRELGARNLYVAADEKIELRIGINLGDIIVEGDDILGDGVNVAARLETLAEPGGICVASAVWEQVHEDLGVEFVDSGMQQVKNISKPIRVYRVSLGKGQMSKTSAGAADTPAPISRIGVRRAAVSVAVVTLLAVIAAGAWWFLLRPDAAVPPTVAGPPPWSVMVVPFSAPQGDDALQRTADSLTADVTRLLADSVRNAQIAAPGLASTYKGKALDARTVGREVNVRYLVEGDVRTVGEEVAVTARLIDTAGGKQLASERRTVLASRLNPDYELLVSRLTSATRLMLFNAEGRRAAADPTLPTTAQGMVDRANMMMGGNDLASIREARKLYDDAIRKDPSLVAAWVGRTRSYNFQFFNDFSADRRQVVDAMERDSLRAVTLDDRDPTAWAARSWALARQWHWEAAVAANERAMALDPTRFNYLISRASLLILSGHAAEALKVIDVRTTKMGTADSDALFTVCHAKLHLGLYQEAIDACERGIASEYDYWTYIDLTAAYAQTGDMTKAAAAKAELLRLKPEFTISRIEALGISNNPTWIREIRTQFATGLRKAGVPE